MNADIFRCAVIVDALTAGGPCYSHSRPRYAVMCVGRYKAYTAILICGSQRVLRRKVEVDTCLLDDGVCPIEVSRPLRDLQHIICGFVASFLDDTTAEPIYHALVARIGRIIRGCGPSLYPRVAIAAVLGRQHNVKTLQFRRVPRYAERVCQIEQALRTRARPLYQTEAAIICFTIQTEVCIRMHIFTVLRFPRGDGCCGSSLPHTAFCIAV